MSRPVLIHASNAFACFALAVALAACGGGGGSDDGDSSGGGGGGGGTTPPPVTTPNPTAAFTAPASATAQTAIAFDASGSSSADASALSYSWDFGDGQRGGGAKIAHAFASAGTATVKLTVIDGGGRVGTKTLAIPVAAAAAATGTTVVHLAVVDATGAAVPSVAVTRAGSTTALGSTDGVGLVDVTLDRGTPFSLKLVKGGYTDQMVAVQLPAGAGTDTRLQAVMHARAASVPLPDAHLGGLLLGQGGASITLPADALVTASGSLATGPVGISMTPVDPTLSAGGGFPGQFKGVEADATTSPLASFGTVEFVIGDPDARMNLAPGKTATIELPLFALKRFDGTAIAVNDTIPLWSLDENTGLWVQEGTGTVVASAASASGLAMRATVSHFSWWNSDYVYKWYAPKPRCIYDDDIGIPEARDTFNTATVCHMLADIDRTLGGSGGAIQSKDRVRAQALTAADQYAGYSAQLDVQAGPTQDQFIPVPPNIGTKIHVTALNGTWVGETSVNGAVGNTDAVTIKMRPVNYSGPTPEALTMPFDVTRGTQPTRVARFTFTGSAQQFVRLRVDPATGVTQTGTVRLLQGTTTLATASFTTTSEGVVLYYLPADGTYTIEVQVDQDGSTRLQGEILGGSQNATLAFPTDTPIIIPVFGSYVGTFDVPAPAAIHLAAQVTAGSTKGELRLYAPDGSIVWSASGVNGSKVAIADIQLPGAGRYAFLATTSDGTAINLRLTTDAIGWTQQGETQPVSGLFSMGDLVADRNGKPVMGFSTAPVVGGTLTYTIQLRRFTGTVWEDVGPIITIDHPCSSNTPHQYSFAFDSANVPTLVYASSNATQGYLVSAVRLTAGTWQAVGPNNGALPDANVAANATYGCDNAGPRLTMDAADHPVVAYRGIGTNMAVLFVRRFDGSAWGKLATTATDSWATIHGWYDVSTAPDGTLWFADIDENTGYNGTTHVRRFDTAAGNWVAAGPSDGALPTTAQSVGFSMFRIAFDAAGRPALGGLNSLCDTGSCTASTIVYRYDGSAWSTTGGFLLPDSYINQGIAGFAMAGDTAYVSWYNQYRSSDANANLVVQTETPSGWTAVGPGVDGSLNAYLARGATPKRFTGDPRLLVIGSDVYLSAVLQLPASGGSTTSEAVLLKKVR